MGAPVVHFEIGAADARAARRFYGDLFGWTVAESSDGYGLVDTGAGTGIGGGIMQAPEQVAPWVTFYVAVDDLESCLERAVELGGRRITGPMPVGEAGSMAMFTDLDGNLVGLFSEKG